MDTRSHRLCLEVHTPQSLTCLFDWNIMLTSLLVETGYIHVESSAISTILPPYLQIKFGMLNAMAMYPLSALSGIGIDPM